MSDEAAAQATDNLIALRGGGRGYVRGVRGHRSARGRSPTTCAGRSSRVPCACHPVGAARRHRFADHAPSGGCRRRGPAPPGRTRSSGGLERHRRVWGRCGGDFRRRREGDGRCARSVERKAAVGAFPDRRGGETTLNSILMSSPSLDARSRVRPSQPSAHPPRTRGRYRHGSPGRARWDQHAWLVPWPDFRCRTEASPRRPVAVW